MRKRTGGTAVAAVFGRPRLRLKNHVFTGAFKAWRKLKLPSCAKLLKTPMQTIYFFYLVLWSDRTITFYDGPLWPASSWLNLAKSELETTSYSEHFKQSKYFFDISLPFSTMKESFTGPDAPALHHPLLLPNYRWPHRQSSQLA